MLEINNESNAPDEQLESNGIMLNYARIIFNRKALKLLDVENTIAAEKFFCRFCHSLSQ